MSSNDESVPLKACALPGMVRVTDGVLRDLARLQAAVPSGHVVAIIWFDGQKIRASKDAPWIDQGPGLGLGAYRTEDIPSEALLHAGPLTYAVLVSREILGGYPDPTIDLDDDGQLILT